VSKSIRRIFDGWKNLVTGLGVEGKDHRLAAEITSRGRTNWAAMEALYAEDGIFSRIVDTPPDYGTKRWIEIKAQGDETDPESVADFGKDVISQLDVLGMREHVFEWWKQGRIYGGAAMIFGVNDGQTPDQPLDVARIKSFDFVHVLSCQDVTIARYDIEAFSPRYGEPEILSIGGKNVHASRCALYFGVAASRRDRINKQGWGGSEMERVLETHRRISTLWGYIEGMYKDAIQGVMSIKGLNELLASEDGTSLARSRLSMVAQGASVYNAILMDADGEKYERRQISFSGLDTPILRAMDELSAVSEIPLSKLFGQAPSGLSTDDASGDRTFNDGIATKQRRILRPVLERTIEYLIAAKRVPNVSIDNWNLEFKPLSEPTEQERATTDKTKAETDVALVSQGIISETEARSRWKSDPASPYILESEEAPIREPDPLETSFLRDPIAPPVPAPEDPTA
jgi:phage-related protein (TIGR01555 family)